MGQMTDDCGKPFVRTFNNNCSLGLRDVFEIGLLVFLRTAYIVYRLLLWFGTSTELHAS